VGDLAQIAEQGGISMLAVFQTISASMSKYPWINLLRMSVIVDQGITGDTERVSSETLLAASPSTSIARTTAKSSI
jgi:hypothetical protein